METAPSDLIPVTKSLKSNLVLIATLCILFTTSLLLKTATSTVWAITNSGNFLFYNSPVFAQFNNNLFVAFVTRNGKVQVKKYRLDKQNRQQALQHVGVWNVHDYSGTINRRVGLADDHAAPSIIYNSEDNRLLLATSYHGSDLFIYEFDFLQNEFNLIKKITGSFTYPRLINWHDDILLVLRDQPKGSTKGDLVFYTLSTGFDSSQTIVPSVSGNVVYGSRPDVYGKHIYVAYSTLDYSNKRLVGWNIVKYNLDAMEASDSFDLSNYLDNNYYSNRPTAIRIINNNIMVGTAITFCSPSFENYVLDNKIVILTLDADGMLIKKNHVNTVKAPYYPTSIDINTFGDWVYFDKTRPRSSINLDLSLFRGSSNMYPHFWGRNIFFAANNKDDYKIRD